MAEPGRELEGPLGMLDIEPKVSSYYGAAETDSREIEDMDCYKIRAAERPVEGLEIHSCNWLVPCLSIIKY